MDSRNTASTMVNFANLLKNAYTMLHSYVFKVDGRMNSDKFSRKSKLSFAETCLLTLRGSKRSLQAAINTFLDESKLELETYSKQAFSERRQYIKPEAFLKLFRLTVEEFYTKGVPNPKKYRGFNVFAIDGTTYNLPNTPELKELYGIQTSQGEPQTQAKGSCLYDVLNNLLVDVRMRPVKSSERDTAVEHLNYLHQLKPGRNLVLFDRGYPSLELIRYFGEHNMIYLMRCNKAEFISEVRKVSDEDTIIQIDRLSRKTKVPIQTEMRVIHIPLDNGIVETLITNLLDDSFTVEDFKRLYHLRWGIEEKYDELKNKLKIEAFSGTTPIAILQDFYATMFLTNLVAYAEMDCEAELESLNESRDRKYTYRINSSIAIASVKDYFVKVVMEDNPLKQKLMFIKLRKRLLSSVVPIRPGRSFSRRRKHTSSDYPQNRKDV